MATPIWYEYKQQWILRITKNGVTKTFTSKKKGLAGKKLVLKKAREYEYGIPLNPNITVAKCWELFTQDTIMRLGPTCDVRKKLDTFGKYFVLPAIGKRRLNSLVKSDYQNILNTAKPHVKNKETLSKKYILEMKNCIQKFIKWCVENEYCEPLRGTLYVPVGLTTREKVILQPDQLKRLFEPAPQYHYHRCLLMIAATGMRPGEALGLQWKDIKNNEIHIQRSINNDGEITHGKNANARRTIPVTNFISNILKEQKKATEKLESEWVFCSPIGTMPNQNTLANTYYRLSQERGLVGSPYTLRHTFVSLVKNVMPEQMVKMLVGHSEEFQTFEVYGHKVDGELRQAAEIMDLTFDRIAK